MAGGRSALSLGTLLLLIHLLGMPLGPFGVLLGEGTVLDRLAPMRIGGAAQLLSLRGVSVRLLTVTRCFGSKSLSPDPPVLRPAPDVSDGSREREHRDHDYGDHKNR